MHQYKDAVIKARKLNAKFVLYPLIKANMIVVVNYKCHI